MRSRAENPERFSFHESCCQRAGQRAITEEPFKRAVLLGTAKKQGETKAPHGGFKYLYRWRTDDRELCIVAEIFKDECFFITGFWQ